MSENKQEDRRILKTKNLLWEALLNQARIQSWDSINVRGICAEANVARSSFYLHFGNKFELLDFGFFHGMETAKAFVQSHKTPKGEWATFYWFFDHISDKDEFFKEDGPANDFIFARFQRSVCEVLTYELALKRSRPSNEAISFAVGGVFSVLKSKAVKQGQKLSGEERKQLNHWANLVLGIETT